VTQKDFRPTDLYFLYPRWLFTDGVYARDLTSPMKAVLPALMRYMNSDGTCYPSITSLCRVSGVSKREAVINALQSLRTVGLIEIQKERFGTSGRRNTYARTWTTPEAGKDGTGWFPFYHSVIQGGNWRKATPTAKALYPVLRHLAKLHADDDHDDGSGTGWIGRDELHDHLQARQWDILRRSHYQNVDLLVDTAGISRRSFWSAMQSLADCHLLEPFDNNSGAYKVYLRPPEHFAHNHVEEGDGVEQQSIVQKGDSDSAKSELWGAKKELDGVPKGNSDSAKRELEVSSPRIEREESCPTPERGMDVHSKPWIPYRLTNHPEARATSNTDRVTPEEKRLIINGIVERVMRDGPNFNRTELWWDLGNTGLPVGQMSSFTGRFYTPNLRQIRSEQRRRSAEVRAFQ